MTTRTAQDGTQVIENRMLRDDEGLSDNFQTMLRRMFAGVDPLEMTSYLVVVGGGPGFTEDGPNVAMIAGGKASEVHGLWEGAHKHIESMAATEAAAKELDRIEADEALDEVPTSVLEAALERRKALDEGGTSGFGLLARLLTDCGNPNCPVHGRSLGAY